MSEFGETKYSEHKIGWREDSLEHRDEDEDEEDEKMEVKH